MMKHYFYAYSIVSGIALAVHLIINWRELFAVHDARTSVWTRDFRRFLVCLTAFFMFDVLWGVLAEVKIPRLLYADTVLYFLAMALTVSAWTRFVASYLGMSGLLKACTLWMGYGLLSVFVVTLVVNNFTGCCFSVSSDGEYAAAPLRHMMLILLIVFNALSSALMLGRLVRTEGAARRRNRMVFAFGMTMMTAIVLQLMNPLLPLYAVGCLFGVCLLHVFVVEDERDDLREKELLARGYKTRLEAQTELSRSKSLFFSTVSHDIRTPLNAIVGFSELLESGVSDEKERQSYISSICSSSKVLARLVDDVLDLSRLDSGQLKIFKEPTDVPELVREVIAACEGARSRSSLILKVEVEEMPTVSVDPQRVRQVLFNLLSNAYKYTERGTITVSARWLDGILMFSVADTGKGIAKGDMERIFQPFVQLVDRNHRDGTGLGLPICRQLVELMGGELTLDSEVGVGSTFTVALKAAAERTVEIESEKPADAVPHTDQVKNLRVLVVDDSSINCEVLESLLNKCGVCDVAKAENGNEAFEILRRDPSFDAVFTDLWMPELDGYGLLRAIRADGKISSIPVFLLTADVAVRSEAESKGFNGVLMKPITLESLRKLLP